MYSSVGRYILNEGNKRGDWMKHWLMLQDYTALNTMYRKTPQKQTTFVSPKGNEEQIDYILTKRRYLRHNKDAEVNDMIHMDHKKNTRGKHDMIKHEDRVQAEKTLKLRSLSSKK